MGLHCENDDILRTGCSIVVGCIHMLHRRLGSIAVDDPAAAGAQRIQIRAACDEGHLVTGMREPGSQVTANRSDPDDRYLHCVSSMERMWRRSQRVELQQGARDAYSSLATLRRVDLKSEVRTYSSHPSKSRFHDNRPTSYCRRCCSR